jgi:hypothetical protein
MVSGAITPWIAATTHTAPAVVRYDTVTGRPTKLEQINEAQGNKLGSIAPGADVTGDNTSRDTAAVSGTPAGTVITNITTAGNNAVTALNAVKNGAGTVTNIQTVIDSVTAETSRATNALETARTSLNTDIGTVRTGVTEAKADAAKVRSDLAPLVSSAQADATTARNDLASEVTRAKGAEGAITTSVTNLKTTVDGHTTAISDNYTTLTNADTALTNRIQTLESDLNTPTTGVKARLSTEESTRANADSALAGRATTIESQFRGETASTILTKLNDNATTAANATQAVANRTTTIEANYQNAAQVDARATTVANAKVSEEAMLRSNADSALATRATTVESKLEGTAPSGLQTLIKNNKRNLIDTGWWKKGASIPWGLNGGQRNEIVEFPDGSNFDGLAMPDGSSGDAWLCQADASGGAAGGWNGGPITPLDPDKTYRFVIPIARFGPGGSVAYWGTYSACDLNTTNENGNPYFAIFGNLPLNKWHLFIGYLFPRNSTGKTHDGAGVWDIATGVQLGGGANYCFMPDGRQPIHRAYQYYATNGSYQGFGRPVIELVDGSETPLQATLSAARGVTAANARITDTSTTLSNATKAVADRTTTIEANYQSAAQVDGRATTITNAKVAEEALARSNADSALATRATSLEARTNGGGNLLTNTDFQSVTAGVVADGWFPGSATAVSPNFGKNAAGDPWHPVGEDVLSIYQPGQAGASGYTVWNSAPFAVASGTYLHVSCYMASHRCQTELIIYWRNTTGDIVGASVTGADGDTGNNGNGGQSLSAWRRQGLASVQVPANAFAAHIELRKYNTNPGQGDSYAWFARPMASISRAGVTELPAFSPGSAKSTINATSARIGAEETARANGDGALSGRLNTVEANYQSAAQVDGRATTIANAKVADEALARTNADNALAGRANTLEAQFRGETGSNVLTRIANEESARASGDSAIASRTGLLEAVASSATNTLNPNPTFTMWPDGQALPNGMTWWSKASSTASKSTSNLGRGGYGLSLVSYAGEESGIGWDNIYTTNGWHVMEADVWLQSGAWEGSGLTLGGVYSLDFLRDPDTNGGIGEVSYGGVRRFTKLINFTDSSYRTFHPMNQWGGFSGNRRAKTMLWLRAALRAATAGEILAGKVNNDLGSAVARIATVETATADGRFATSQRASNIESSVSGVSGRLSTVETATTDGRFAAANRVSTLEASSSRAGYLTQNPLYLQAGWANQSSPPPGWSYWVTDGNPYIGWYTGVTPSNYGAPYAVQIDRQGTNCGIYHTVIGQFPRGYYVMEADVRLEDGNVFGSGMHVNFNTGSADQMDFARHPDSAGSVGDLRGNRSYTKLVFNATDTDRMHVYMMAGWSGFNGYTGFIRSIWHKAGIRPATSEEIAVGKAGGLSARVTTTEGAVSNLNGRTASYWQTTAVAGNNRAQLTVKADANGGAGVDIVGDVNFSGNLNVGADGGGNRMKITNQNITVFDGNGTMRVRMGIW